MNCYIKFLDIREVFNEALASALCKLAGLRTPDACVVEVLLADYPASAVLARAGTPEVIAFATAAMPLESFVRRADLRSPDARRAAVAHWTDWPEVLTFDQWVRNVDRHPGNFLIGGPGEIYLIDHGLAFRGNNWTAERRDDQAMDRGACTRHRSRGANGGCTCRSSVRSQGGGHRRVPRAYSRNLPPGSQIDRTALGAFRAARAQNAAWHVCNTIGVPTLALGVGLMTTATQSEHRPRFPVRQTTHEGQWLPLYLEPLPGSGGRICVGVIASSGASIEIAEVPELHRLQAIYGPATSSFTWAARLTMLEAASLAKSEGLEGLKVEA